MHDTDQYDRLVFVFCVNVYGNFVKLSIDYLCKSYHDYYITRSPCQGHSRVRPSRSQANGLERPVSPENIQHRTYNMAALRQHNGNMVAAWLQVLAWVLAQSDLCMVYILYSNGPQTRKFLIYPSDSYNFADSICI